MAELPTTDHLSDLALEALEAGELWPGSDHLKACASCTRRRELLHASTLELRGHPRFGQTKEAAQRAAQQGPPGRTRVWVLGALAASAAALTVAIFARRPPPGNLTKGAPTLDIVAATGILRGPVMFGDHVHLRAGGAGHPFALVYGVDPHCQVDLLWPSGATQAGPVPGVTDLGEFLVTPDPMRLWAIFFDTPVPELEVHAALAAEVAQSCRAGQLGTEAVPDRLPHEAGRADVQMQ